MAAGGLKVLFDENFSQHHVRFVNTESGLGYFTHSRPMSWSGMPDRDWIPRAIDLGFVIVTGDRNEKTRTYTIGDLKAMGARVILVGGFWDHMGRWDKA